MIVVDTAALDAIGTPIMPKFETRGRVLLAEWAAEHEKTQKKLAELIGVSQPQVSDWLAGESRPSAPARERIKLLLAIDTTCWLLPGELSPLTGSESASQGETAQSGVSVTGAEVQ